MGCRYHNPPDGNCPQCAMADGGHLLRVQCAANALGHTAKCPNCGGLTLVTGPPQKVECQCGSEWFATWWRHGDPIIKIQST